MENAVIYVSGDPNAYPIEYYDEQSDSFQGMIPALLQDFAEETGLTVRYYQPEKGDQRQFMAEHCQVDIITCRGEASQYEHSPGGEVMLFNAVQGGEEVVYQLLVTQAAPKDLTARLKAYFSGVSHETQMGLLIESAAREQPVNENVLYAAGIAALLAILILAGTIAALIRHYRAKLRALNEHRETDEVTGIGNKEYLEHYYQQYINDQNRILYRLLYFYVDAEQLDRTVGRAMTDEYMRHIAVTLKEHIGDMDILARVSEGGFALLRMSLDDQEEQAWLRPVFERLMGAPIVGQLARRRYYAVGSYSLRPTDRDLYSILFDASQCAQSAYRDGVEFRACTDAVLETLSNERLFRTDIQNGLKNREFLLYLQPYVDVKSGKIVGGEALSRWEHPARGLLLPGDFLPFMEREHLTHKLDELSLENACQYLENAHQSGEESFFISCNFSEESFSSADFVENCLKVIEKFHFPRKLLLLELKDNSAVRDVRQISKNIQSLRQMGVSIALDDFGTLFSALADMEEIPLDVVKLSRKLVSGIGNQRRDAVLVGVIQVISELGIGMIAEGVETKEQSDFLMAHGCHMQQGFYFYKPIPGTEVKRIASSGGEDLHALKK